MGDKASLEELDAAEIRPAQSLFETFARLEPDEDDPSWEDSDPVIRLLYRAAVAEIILHKSDLLLCLNAPNDDVVVG